MRSKRPSGPRPSRRRRIPRARPGRAPPRCVAPRRAPPDSMSMPRPRAAGSSRSSASSRQPVPVPRSSSRSGAARSGSRASAACTSVSLSGRGSSVAAVTRRRGPEFAVAEDLRHRLAARRRASSASSPALASPLGIGDHRSAVASSAAPAAAAPRAARPRCPPAMRAPPVERRTARPGHSTSASRSAWSSAISALDQLVECSPSSTCGRACRASG